MSGKKKDGDDLNPEKASEDKASQDTPGHKPDDDPLAFDTALKRVLDSARDDPPDRDRNEETVFQRKIELDETGSADDDGSDSEPSPPEGVPTRVGAPLTDLDANESATVPLTELPKETLADEAGTVPLSELPPDESATPVDKPGEDEDAATVPLSPLSPAQVGEPESVPTKVNAPLPEQEEVPTKINAPLPTPEELEPTRLNAPLPKASDDPRPDEKADRDEAGNTIFQPVVELSEERDEEPDTGAEPPLPVAKSTVPPAAQKPAPAPAPPARAGTQVMAAPPVAAMEPSSVARDAGTEVLAADRLPQPEAPASRGMPPWLPYAGGALGLVALVILGMALLGRDDEPIVDPQPDPSQTLILDLVELQGQTLIRANELSSKLTEVLTLARNTRQKLMEIEALLADAEANGDAEQVRVLEEERNEFLMESARLIERANLIRSFVMKDIRDDEIQALSTLQVADLVGESDRAAATERLDSLNRQFQEASRHYQSLESALAARSGFRERVGQWRSYGFSWPLTDADLARLAEADQFPERVLDPGDRAEEMLADGEFDDARTLWAAANTDLDALLALVADSSAMSQGRVVQLLADAEAAMEANHLTSGGEVNAFEAFRSVLEIDPDNEQALAGLGRIVDAYGGLIAAALNRDNLESAERFLDRASTVAEGRSSLDGRVQPLRRRVTEQRELRRLDRLTSALGAVEQAESAGDHDRLVALLDEMMRLGAERSDIQQVEQAMARVAVRPGRRFSDALPGGIGPEMVVLPTGRFTMGEQGRQLARMFGGSRNEKPAHPVVIDRPVALARTEVTVAQFRGFVEATGYRSEPQGSGTARAMVGDSERVVRGRTWQSDFLGDPAADEYPVLYVTWNDAVAYVEWLSDVTGQRYRLPSESEFEFAMRAGTDERFLWGEGDPARGLANLNGQEDPAPRGWADRPSGRGELRRYQDGHFGPAPVATFHGNRFGLHDMLGNTAEWTADCYLEDYEGKGAGQAARSAGACGQRTVRGSDWAGDSASLRLSYRQGVAPGTASNRIGFRVARDLSP